MTNPRTPKNSYRLFGYSPKQKQWVWFQGTGCIEIGPSWMGNGGDGSIDGEGGGDFDGS